MGSTPQHAYEFHGKTSFFTFHVLNRRIRPSSPPTHIATDAEDGDPFELSNYVVTFGKLNVYITCANNSRCYPALIRICSSASTGNSLNKFLCKSIAFFLNLWIVKVHVDVTKKRTLPRQPAFYSYLY